MMIVVAASGRGRTLANLVNHGIPVAKVFSTSAKAGVVGVATELGIPCEILPKDIDESSARLLATANTIVLAGYLRKVVIPPGKEKQVINIHPSLLPAFAGLYGQNIHEAVLKRGCKVTGCTIHYCDNGYDTGPIIAQVPVFVNDDDTPSSLAARVFEAECNLLVKTLKELSNGYG
jgi:phosphoribosylglycinamide formyltransferase-1